MINKKSAVEASGKINQGEIARQKDKKRQKNGRVDKTNRQKIDSPKQFQP